MQYILVNGNINKDLAKENKSGQMARNMKAIGNMIWRTEEED